MLRHDLIVSCALALVAAWATQAAPARRAGPTFTAEQASAGKQAYAAQCSSCHGRTLSGGEFAGPLNGNRFSQDWGGKTAEALFTFVRTRMPPTKPNSLTPQATAAVLAYLIEVNGGTAGAVALPIESSALAGMHLPRNPVAPS